MNSQFRRKGLMIALSAFALGSFITHPIAQATGNGVTWEKGPMMMYWVSIMSTVMVVMHILVIHLAQASYQFCA